MAAPHLSTAWAHLSAQRRLLPLLRRPRLLRRGLASEPSTSTPEMLLAAAAAPASAPRGSAPLAALAAASRASHGGGGGDGGGGAGAGAGAGGGAGGVWQRLVSFLSGAGLAGALGYSSLLHDIEHSTRSLEGALAGLRGEAGALHRETRERIALLEHEVALLKRAAAAAAGRGDDGGEGGGYGFGYVGPRGHSGVRRGDNSDNENPVLQRRSHT